MTVPTGTLGYDAAIAVIGRAGRFPGAHDVETFWRNLRDGVESIVRYTDDELRAAGVPEALLADPAYVKAGAPLPDMEWFDAALFGISPREAALMDPQHRHFLEVAWEALEDAGIDPRRARGAIGVYGGSGHNAYMPYNLLPNRELMASAGFFLVRHTSNDKDFLTTRVSFTLDLKGPSLNVQTACSTSLVATHLACQGLLAGECDVALAGGCTIELPHRQGYLYQEGEILSPDGHCRAFDAASAGTVFGSAAGCVVLKRMSDALRDGDTIHAVIRASAINNDGAGKAGYLAPSVDGQAQAVAVALALGDVDPATVSYVETHGTGTRLGDPIEVQALTQAFGQGTERAGPCRIGSVKSNIGHTDAAAGVASLIKVVEALRHRELPPTLHVTEPNPACGFDDSPFQPNTSLMAWEAPWPRRAGVTSLGVGGTNAHLIVEEAPVPVPGDAGREAELLVVSGHTPKVLEENAGRLAAWLRAHPDAPLADVAWTLATGRRLRAYRRFVVASTPAEGADRLVGRDGPWSRTEKDVHEERSVAFMFGGVGTQYAGMGRDLHRAEPVYRESLDRTLGLASSLAGVDLLALLFPAPGKEEEAGRELQRPSRQFPTIFATQLACATLWRSWGIVPTAMIGHSLGEYCAAHLSGVLSLEEALRVVMARASLVERLPPGAMLSVPLPAAELRALLGPQLSLAVENGPALSVASGPVSAIEELQAGLAQRGVEAQRLRAMFAAHSSMLDPILEDFRAVLSSVRFGTPTIPWVSNLTGTWIAPSQAASADYWVRHLRETVRFADGLAAICADPSRVLLEVGPGRTLATLAGQFPGRLAAQPVVTSMRHPTDDVPDVPFALAALGRLWAANVPVDWDAQRGGRRRRRLSLPATAFDRRRHWHEPPAAGAHAAYASTARRADPATWLSQPSWRRASLSPRDPQLPGRTLLLLDGEGVLDEVGARLSVIGADVVRVETGEGFARLAPSRYALDPASRDDWASLLDALQGDGGPPRSIVHGLCLGGKGDPLAEETVARHEREAFQSLLTLGHALANRETETPVALTVLSSGLHAIGEDELPEAGKALLLGPVRVMPRELPHVAARSVDVAPGSLRGWRRARLVSQLTDELRTTPDAPVVAWRGDDRHVQVWEAAPPSAPLEVPRMRDGGTVLVTGGLGALGLAVAEHLAKVHEANVVLVSRRVDAARSTAAERRISEAGGRALVLEADVADADSLTAAAEAARAAFGGLDGIVHAAGVLDDGPLALKEPSTAARVLAPKVRGTLAVGRVARENGVSFVALFSSISAVAGPAGQADYAAANAFLDAWAEAQRRADGAATISLGWGPWRDIGVAANLAAGLVRATSPRHPFLDRLVRDGAGERMWLTSVDPARHWMVGEHRLAAGNVPVLPGTGYLELARAAFAERTGDARVVLEDVVFRAPFVADPAPRDLCVRLVAGERGTRFAVLGRSAPGASTWVEHATGVLHPAPAARASALEIDAIRARCTRGSEAPAPTRHLRFGPRWRNLRGARWGEGEVLLTLELPAEFTDDLRTFALHPALLDMATGSAQALVPDHEPDTDFYVPVSYGTLRLHAPLTPVLLSHVRLRGTEGGKDLVAYDVTLCDTSGAVLAEVVEFTMMRVAGDALAGSAAPGSTTVELDPEAPAGSVNARAREALELDGIATADGLAVLDLVLAHRTPAHVLVTPRPPEAVVASFDPVPPAATGEPRAGEDALEEVEMTPVERAIAPLWRELLGVPTVHPEDDFLALGGHSLLAIRMQRRLRELFPGHTMSANDILRLGTLRRVAAHFDAPTDTRDAAPARGIARRDRRAFLIADDPVPAGATPDQ
jgi:acyl transferase domain-containing protein